MNIGWGTAKDARFYRQGDSDCSGVTASLEAGEVAVSQDMGAIYGTADQMAELGRRMVAEFGKEQPRFVLMVGNPVDGMTFYGPTDAESEGFEQLIVDKAEGSDWWTAVLEPVPGEPALLCGGEISGRYVQIHGFTTEEQAEALRASIGMLPGDFGRYKGGDTVTVDREPLIDRAIEWAKRNGRAYEVTMTQSFAAVESAR